MSTLALLLILFAVGATGLQPDAETPPQPSLLLVEPDHHPHISIAWTTQSGYQRRFESDRAWGTDADRTLLGANISAYVALGGLRLTQGAGHPKGAVVRFGFYKIDPARMFFEDIAANSTVDVEMRGVKFNQPVIPMPGTILQHLKFARDALVSCQIPSNAWSLYNTANPHETLNGRARPGYDTRLGALSGKKPGQGSATAVLEPDGTVTIRASVPYALFKHLRDPWQRAIPGTFLEPIHFHVEVEVLPEAEAKRLNKSEQQGPGD